MRPSGGALADAPAARGIDWGGEGVDRSNGTSFCPVRLYPTNRIDQEQICPPPE